MYLRQLKLGSLVASENTLVILLVVVLGVVDSVENAGEQRRIRCCTCWELCGKEGGSSTFYWEKEEARKPSGDSQGLSKRSVQGFDKERR